MKKIEIIIANQIATPVGAPCIVCGNDNYVIEFVFDSEWNGTTEKTARFKYMSNGAEAYEDVVFNGVICPVPVLSNITEVNIGVYAGDLTTTTPAKIECRKSILCGDGTHEKPSEDVYNQLIEAINTGLVKGDKGDKGEQGVSGIYVGSGEMPENYNIQIDPNGNVSVKWAEYMKEICDIVYPVGSYYWSSNADLPTAIASVGVWETVEGVFLLAASNDEEIGTTGGNSSLELVANIGAVNGDITTLGYLAAPKSAYEAKGASYAFAHAQTITATSVNHSTRVTELNSTNELTNIMPPYEIAKCWKRIK